MFKILIKDIKAENYQFLKEGHRLFATDNVEVANKKIAELLNIYRRNEIQLIYDINIDITINNYNISTTEELEATFIPNPLIVKVTPLEDMSIYAINEGNAEIFKNDMIAKGYTNINIEGDSITADSNDVTEAITQIPEGLYKIYDPRRDSGLITNKVIELKVEEETNEI